MAKDQSKISSTVAKEPDGNIQITFTISSGLIQKTRSEVLEELARDVDVPGFRKGKAPVEKAKEKIDERELIEHTLSHILPSALAEAIKEHSLKIAIYPKYELISSKEDSDWQIRAITCELPEIDLGNYKDAIAGELRSISLKKEPTREEKEQKVVETLLKSVRITIPKILIEEEVESRLSSLLSRIEKLGLSLEGYLTSLGKKVEDLRADYEKQANEAIALDLILSRVFEAENLALETKEINEALSVSASTQPLPENEDPEQRRRVIESILRKRKALEFLIGLK